MFVRKNKHPNGKVYIQVIEKVNRRNIVKKSFGSATNQQDISKLIADANHWIKENQGIQELDLYQERELYETVLSSITSHKLAGVDLVLGSIFDEIGFNKIGDELFKDLVLYRLVYPKSKLKTTEYLYRFSQKSYSEDDRVDGSAPN